MEIFEYEDYLCSIEAKIKGGVRSLVAFESDSVSEVGEQLSSRYVLQDVIKIP